MTADDPKVRNTGPAHVRSQVAPSFKVADNNHYTLSTEHDMQNFNVVKVILLGRRSK